MSFLKKPGNLAHLATVPLLLWSTLALCSNTPCAYAKTLEMRGDFTVAVTHENKPIAGATVEVYTSVEDSGAQLLSAKTSADGKLRITKLAPGA